MKKAFTIVSKLSTGFTIVEVLVVISIMGLIMGVGAVRLRDFQRKQELVSAKRLLLTDVRSAQSDAASGRKPADCSSNETLLGYGFRVQNTSTLSSYQIFARCETGAGTHKDIPVKDVTLPDAISITAPPPLSNPVLFKPVQEGTNFSGSISITISRDGLTNTESLYISASGEIR
jgi:prepilin-type N-terminal cleavage/methylation domain-containing protein